MSAAAELRALRDRRAAARTVFGLASMAAPTPAEVWRLFSSPPSKPGRYIVAHRGGIGGHACYDAPGQLGWSQMPDWNPTHWIPAPSGTPADAPAVKDEREADADLTQRVIDQLVAASGFTYIEPEEHHVYSLAQAVKREVLARLPRASLPSAIATQICRAVAELPDRNSPPDWPEAMLVTSAELEAIVLEALSTT